VFSQQQVSSHKSNAGAGSRDERLKSCLSHSLGASVVTPPRRNVWLMVEEMDIKGEKWVKNNYGMLVMMMCFIVFPIFVTYFIIDDIVNSTEMGNSFLPFFIMHILLLAFTIIILVMTYSFFKKDECSISRFASLNILDLSKKVEESLQKTNLHYEKISKIDNLIKTEYIINFKLADLEITIGIYRNNKKVSKITIEPGKDGINNVETIKNLIDEAMNC